MSSKSTNPSVTTEKSAYHAYRGTVRKLVAQTFGLSGAEMYQEDQIWERWLVRVEKERELCSLFRRGKNEEARPLCRLLQDKSLKDSFGARVLAVLSAPTLAWTPFRYPTRDLTWSYAPEWFSPWRTEYSLRGYDETETFFIGIISELSEPLQQFFWMLLEINLNAMVWHKPRGLGRPTSMESERNVAYNRLILRSLAALPIDSPEAERLFAHYQTNPTNQWLGLWLVGANYTPFQEILTSAMVPEQWKRLADAQWRNEIFTRQVSCVESIRRDWFDMVQRYGYAVEESLNGSQGAISANLVASQIAWILDAVDGTAARPFRYDAWNQVLATLRHNRYQEIRHCFVRHMVLSDGQRPFRVTDDIAPAVEEALTLFGAADQELATKLQVALAEYAARVTTRDVEVSQMKAAVAAMY